MFTTSLMQRVGKKPYERDVFAQVGDVLFKGSKNLGAIAGLTKAIQLDPMHPDAPKLQDLIVQAWERERRFDKASEAREELVRSYSRESAWAEANKNKPSLVRHAEKLARASLYKAAIFHHQQAIKFFEEERQDLGVQSYAQASKGYEEYLRRYPHDKEAYELSFYLAETYYYSLKFDKAFVMYEKVRDSKLGDKYRGDAGLAAIYAYEKVIEADIKSGKLEARELFSGQAPAVDKTPEDIPSLRQGYVGAIDKYLNHTPGHEQAPAFAYQAAAVFYAYRHFDEAIKRFEGVIQKFPKHQAARASANFILDYLLAKKDWKTAAAYAARFKNEAIGGGEELEAFAKIEGGARFQMATEVLNEGDKALKEGRITVALAKLEEGADAYLELLEKDPKREFADAMLYNAALSLEKARRPLRAAKLYERLYKEYPKSNWAPEAMFRVASKSEQAFQFDRAVRTYQALVKKYKESDQAADAQLNAALALEGQQKYGSANREFEQFIKLFPEREEVPDVYFRVALVHGKRGDKAAQVKALKRFIGKYKSDASQRPRVVEANVLIGDIHRESAEKSTRWRTQNRLRKDAKTAYRNAIALQARTRGSATATYFAAKAALLLANFDFAEYDTMTIKAKNSKKQRKELEEKAKRLDKVQKQYEQVIAGYRQAEWSLASLYQIGALYDDLQATIFDAPCPRDIRRIDEIACDEYRNLLEDQANNIEAKAVEAYKTAKRKGEELKLQNEWTEKTLAALNRLRPDEYQVDNKPLVSHPVGAVDPLGFHLPDGGAKKARGVVPLPSVQAPTKDKSKLDAPSSEPAPEDDK
jgi:TolA-binding protein